jgi:tubulin polyglutamylase TTLL6/13
MNFARVKKNKTYICKPDSGCQGRGIFITKNPYKDIKPGDNYVAQLYVSRVFSWNKTYSIESIKR